LCGHHRRAGRSGRRRYRVLVRGVRHAGPATDDLDAEVERLLTLGATKVSQWLNCHVLRAPGGHLLCVVPVHSDQALFDAQARTWS
jgi:hypothetical protein